MKSETSWRKRAQSRVSWSPWFTSASLNRRRAEFLLRAGENHAAAAWLLACRTNQRSRLLDKVTPKITGHAPWLNADAIGYRNAVGADTFNGWYLQ